MTRRAPSTGSACVSWFLGAAALLTARSASADPPLAEASLSYERQPGAEVCATEAILRKQVALRLGYDPFRDGAAHRVTVIVSPRGGGFAAHIETEDTTAGKGERAARDLDSDDASCEELLQSVVLAVSLAIDPLSLSHPRAPAPAAPPPPGAPVTPAARPEAQKGSTPAPPPSMPWTFETTAAARVGFGLVPGVSAGPVVGFRAGQKSWALLAEAGADLPTSSVTAPTSGEAGVEATLLRGGLGGCGILSWLSLCGRVDLGALEGSGTGEKTIPSRTTLYADVALEAGLSIPIYGGVRVFGVAELIVPLTRTALDLGMLAPWQTPTLAGALDLGVGYRF